jgi:hypothetical protein
MDGSYVPMAASARGRNGVGDSRLAPMLASGRESLRSILMLRTSGRIGFRAHALDWLVEP